MIIVHDQGNENEIDMVFFINYFFWDTFKKLMNQRLPLLKAVNRTRHRSNWWWFKTSGTRNWYELSQTEIIWDNQNPDFEKKVEMEYHFEVHQQLRFFVYNFDEGVGVSLSVKGEADEVLNPLNKFFI